MLLHFASDFLENVLPFNPLIEIRWENEDICKDKKPEQFSFNPLIEIPLENPTIDILVIVHSFNPLIEIRGMGKREEGLEPNLEVLFQSSYRDSSVPLGFEIFIVEKKNFQSSYRDSRFPMNRRNFLINVPSFQSSYRDSLN